MTSPPILPRLAREPAIPRRPDIPKRPSTGTFFTAVKSVTPITP